MVISFVCITNYSFAEPPNQYSVVIESNTQITINKLNKIAKLQQIQKKSMGDIVQWVSLQLLNSPYKYYLLDRHIPEYLYISLNDTDCMLFIEEVVVVSRLLQENKLTLDNYVAGIKQIRYHGDVTYCNRNHYFKDWAVMNERQGIVMDIASNLMHIRYPYLANVMSKNIAKNPENMHYPHINCIIARESVVNTEQIGFIPLKQLSKYLKYVQSGDIIGIIRNPTKADPVQHLGIAYLHDGKVGMIDASSIHSKVVIEESLLVYLAKFNNSKGIILFRIQE